MTPATRRSLCYRRPRAGAPGSAVPGRARAGPDRVPPAAASAPRRLQRQELTRRRPTGRTHTCSARAALYRPHDRPVVTVPGPRSRARPRRAAARARVGPRPGGRRAAQRHHCRATPAARASSGVGLANHQAAAQWSQQCTHTCSAHVGAGSPARAQCTAPASVTRRGPGPTGEPGRRGRAVLAGPDPARGHGPPGPGATGHSVRPAELPKL